MTTIFLAFDFKGFSLEILLVAFSFLLIIWLNLLRGTAAWSEISPNRHGRYVLKYRWLGRFFMRIEFDEEFLYSFPPWRRSSETPWSEVTAFDTDGRHYIFTTRNGATIRVRNNLPGLHTLLRQWRIVEEARTPQTERERWPKTLNEAVSLILAEASEDDKRVLRDVDLDVEAYEEAYDRLELGGLLTRVFDQTGVWGLWQENRALIEDCKAKNPDEYAGWVIIDAVRERLLYEEGKRNHR